LNYKHIIWSNYDLDFEKWKPDLQAEYPDKSDNELQTLMYETNNDYLADERMNLDIKLPQNILIIADIGRWNGRFSGYKEIQSGNIKDCLYYECDYSTWFVDKNGDLRCDAIHHDGTNHYLYRTLKNTATDTQIENLKNKIYNGTAARADLVRVTDRLGDKIAKVYGFDMPKLKQAEYER